MALFSRSASKKKQPVIRETDAYIAETKALRKRRKRFLIGSGALLTIGLMAIGAAWTILYSPIFQIKEITVQGNSVTPKDAITASMDTRILTASLINTILGFRNVFAWSEGSYESHAPELPRVRSISVDRSYINRTVQINVDERAPFGIWCSGEKEACFWFDREGVLLDSAPAAAGNLIPVVHDYSEKYLRSQTKVLDTSAVENLATIFDVLSATNLNVREVRLEDRSLQELTVVLQSGPVLYFSLRFPAAETASVITSLKKNGGGKNPYFSELQSIDFRVEHRAYYK